MHHRLSVIISNVPLRSDWIFSSITLTLPTSVPSDEFSRTLNIWPEEIIGSSLTGFILMKTETVSTPLIVSLK